MEIIQEVSTFDVICHKRKWGKTVSHPHWHNRYELCQVLDKEITITVEGRKICAKTGDIVAIDQRVVHAFAIEQDNTVARICQFPTKLLINLKNSVKPLKTHIKAEEIQSIPELSDKINTLFEMMEKEKNENTPIADSFLQSLATSAYFLFERYFPEEENRFVPERDRREFYDVVKYITDSYKDDITVESISKALFLSRGRLTSIFRKYTGESVTDYINRLRIKNANYLLSDGKSITNAALESGFQSIRTFNNVYKSVMNLTPSEYLKKKKIQQKTITKNIGVVNTPMFFCCICK